MLNIISIDEVERWDKIIKNSVNDAYYLSGYVKGFLLHGDGIPELIFYDNGSVKALNVVMKRDIAKSNAFKDKLTAGNLFDYSTPYGYGGFIFIGKKTDEDIRILNSEYEKLCLKNHVVSEFVRFHPVLNNYRDNVILYNTVRLGSTVIIDLKDKNQIWYNLSSKNRNSIRKAKNSGVSIYWGRSPELYERFRLMYNETMKKVHAADYYFFGAEYFNSLLYDLLNNAVIFYAEMNSVIIAMSIILYCGEQIHYHLSASVTEYLTYAPTNLLLFSAAEWGSEHGYKSFHLGGGLGSKTDSLYKFKKSFYKYNDRCYYIGKKIFDDEQYNKLIAYRSNNMDFNKGTDFFPLYRG